MIPPEPEEGAVSRFIIDLESDKETSIKDVQVIERLYRKWLAQQDLVKQKE